MRYEDYWEEGGSPRNIDRDYPIRTVVYARRRDWDGVVALGFIALLAIAAILGAVPLYYHLAQCDSRVEACP